MKRGFFIGGEYFAPAENIKEIINPYDGRVVSTICMASEKEREMSVSLAFDSFEKVSMIPLANRIDLLEGLKDGIEQRREEIAGTICLEAGKPTGIFTRDMSKAYRAYRLWRVGGVIVNDVPTYRHDSMPYGGTKDSGIGREGPRYTMEEMTEMRVMVVNPL
jgi:acyl-CoA reductase-like NAD-dependent aldehyde dehydrogenase